MQTAEDVRISGLYITDEQEELILNDINPYLKEGEKWVQCERWGVLEMLLEDSDYNSCDVELQASETISGQKETHDLIQWLIK